MWKNYFDYTATVAGVPNFTTGIAGNESYITIYGYDLSDSLERYQCDCSQGDLHNHNTWRRWSHAVRNIYPDSGLSDALGAIILVAVVGMGVALLGVSILSNPPPQRSLRLMRNSQRLIILSSSAMKVEIPSGKKTFPS